MCDKDCNNCKFYDKYNSECVNPFNDFISPWEVPIEEGCDLWVGEDDGSL